MLYTVLATGTIGNFQQVRLRLQTLMKIMMNIFTVFITETTGSTD